MTGSGGSALSHRHRAAGTVAGLCGVGALTGVLVPFRDRVDSANIVLGFVLVAVTAAWIGGRAGGIVTGVAAALSFNVVFTRPYYSLRIDKGGDIVSDALLLAVTLGFALLRERQREAAVEVAASRTEMGDLFAMARAVGQGDDSLGRLAGVVAIMCAAEGAAIVDHRGRIVEAWGSVPSEVDVELLDRLSINGWPPDGPRVIRLDEGRLPVSGALIPVWFDNREIGHIAVFPGPEPVALTRETTQVAAVAATLAGSLLHSA